MVMDHGSLLADRVNGHLCCPFMLSHGHPPSTYAQQVVTDTIYRKDGDSVFQFQLQNMNSCYYFPVTGLQRLLGRMAQLMVGILQMVKLCDVGGGLLTQQRGEGGDFRVRLQALGMRMVIWSGKTNIFHPNPSFRSPCAFRRLLSFLRPQVLYKLVIIRVPISYSYCKNH